MIHAEIECPSCGRRIKRIEIMGQERWDCPDCFFSWTYQTLDMAAKVAARAGLLALRPTPPAAKTEKGD